MRRHLPMVLLALLGAAGCVNAAGDSAAGNADVEASDGDTHSGNRSIHVPDGVKRGELTSVNGTIRIGDDAIVTNAHTVNGDIASVRMQRPTLCIPSMARSRSAPACA
jgi:hypothetical protein